MANKKQFATIENLELFKSLFTEEIAEDISTAEARSLHTVAISQDGRTIKFYREEEPVGQAIPAYEVTIPEQDLSNYLQKLASATGGKILVSKADGTFEEASVSVNDLVKGEITSANGKALVFNESDGGGVKFEHTDGTWSFVGVNDGGASGLSGQIYSVDHNNSNTGTRLNLTTDGFFYTTGKSNASYTADDEIATKGDIKAAGDVSSKTVYMTETAGGAGDPYSKRYGIYQGSEGSSSSPVPSEKLADIDIPKDMVVEDGSVVNVVFKASDSTLHEETESGTDVTAEIMGSATPTASDAGKYIKLIIANASSSHLWIKATDFVDIYTAQQNATQVQLAISASNVISATIVAGSIGTTELANASVTEAKLANDAKTFFIGTAQDTASSNTIYGAKAYADSVAGDATEAIPEEDIRALFSED